MVRTSHIAESTLDERRTKKWPGQLLPADIRSRNFGQTANYLCLRRDAASKGYISTLILNFLILFEKIVRNMGPDLKAG